jgi:hypothetical protein
MKRIILNPNAVTSVAVILVIGLTLLIWKGHGQRQSVKTLVGESPPLSTGGSDWPERRAVLREVGVPAIVIRLSRRKRMAYKEDTRVKHAKENALSQENNETEAVDEIDEDAKILRALQMYTDTVSCEPPAEAALREVERGLEAEIKISEEVATEWTQALTPILHGDDAQAIKGVFQQFSDWAHKREKGVTGSQNKVNT